MPDEFFETLPPDEVGLFYKILIYVGFIFIIFTAITARFITKNRLKTLKQASAPTSTKNETTQMELEADIFDFDNENDKLAGLKIRVVSTEAAISELSKLKESDLISDNAFLSLSTKFTNDLEEFSNVADFSSLEEEIPVTVDVVSEAEEENILDDLGLEEEEDEFLKPRSSPQPTAPKATAPKKFTAPSPAAPKATAPKKFTAPSPAAPKATAPKKFTAPSPATPRAATPNFNTPTPTAPKAVTPQPIGAENDEKVFAKSTSIAAIRMDMLRELARLKKLINEDE